jgi:GrpB-like predicted nucleotidyltransferase (UPF0157 family)
MIRFRDALCGDARLAREYEQLKIGLAEEHAESRAEYTRSKRAFIDKVLADSA